MRRILASLLALLIVLSMVPVTSHAADPNAYPNTYTNSGDQRRDIIQVALTQVGYTEGYNNDTKYGDWYGLPNQPWCGMFVSWCANQARIPTSVIKKGAIANPYYFGFSSYFTASQRRPQSGDLFFKSNFSHVGLVYYVDGDYFYTVEGNTNNSGGWEGVGVMIQRRRLSDCVFVSPNYTSDPGHGYVTGYEPTHPHKEYKSCSHCGDFYYTGNNVVLSDCATCIKENCTHSYGSWSAAGSQHYRVCSICGKEESKDHQYVGGTVTKYATCGTVGYMDQTCTDCGQLRTVTLPPTNEHQYSDWEKVDDDVHMRTCSVCKQSDRASHEVADAYETNASDHWKTCSDCGEVIAQDGHSFGPVCGDPCTVCGYRPPEGHIYGDYLYDGDVHWRECVNCYIKETSHDHVFDSSCDEICDICGYQREVEHAYAETLLMDGNGHWQECTLCGHTSQIQAHVAGPAATEEHSQVCVECGWEIMGKLPHVHRYKPYSLDAITHWGTCDCGYCLEPEGHHWHMDTGYCALCGAHPAPEAETTNWTPVWIAIFGVPVLGILTMFIVWRVKRRNRDWRK